MAGTAAPGPDRLPLGVTMIVFATLTMAFQDAVVKLVSTDLPLWQLFALRSLIAIPLLLVLHRLARETGGLRPRAIGWGLLRGALLVAMYIAFYAALPLLDLSLVAAAYYTGPLFITLFAATLLGEGVGSRRILAIALGFAGVLVILKPGTESFSWAMVIPIASAVFYALAAILTRSKCAAESAISLSLMLNLCFILCGFGVSLVLWIWQPGTEQQQANAFLLGDWVTIDLKTGAVLALLALANVAIHVALAKAYQSAPPPVIATFDYSYLIFAAAWGYLILSEIPQTTTLIGMAVIAGAGMLAIWRPGRRARS